MAPTTSKKNYRPRKRGKAATAQQRRRASELGQRYHAGVLPSNMWEPLKYVEEAFDETQLPSSQINPANVTLHHWGNEWCLANPETRNENIHEPLVIIKEEIDIESPSLEEEINVESKAPMQRTMFQPESQVSVAARVKEENEVHSCLKKELVKKFGDILNKYNPSVAAMETAMQRLESIQSKEQLETMLDTLGMNEPRRRKAGSSDWHHKLILMG